MRAYRRHGLGIGVVLSALAVCSFFIAHLNPSVLAGGGWGPAQEINCPSSGAADPFVGPGTSNFTPNQNLCLPQLAPLPGGALAFIVRGLEPGIRVDDQGTPYVVSIRGVPGGVDLWRWFQAADGGPNGNGALTFKYEGQPDNCGILTNGCANNVDNTTNSGVAPGGGDADIAVNTSLQGVPNLALTSLTLAPGITATNSTNRGDSFFSPPNVVAALIPVDDRMWNDAIDQQTAYVSYHDIATFNIEVQRSNDGGLTYLNGFGEAIDEQTSPAAGGLPPTNSANVAGQIKVDQSGCKSRGNLYAVFSAPDSATENALGLPLRSVYVGVSTDVREGLRTFTFNDHKVFTSPIGSPGSINGTFNVFPALAVDNFGNVYVVWSDNTNIFYSFSTDQGTSWSAPIQVNAGSTVGNANVFPWVAADSDGHVVVAWLGDNMPGNSNDRSSLEPGHPASQGAACNDGTNTCMTRWAEWSVYVAETVNGHAAPPAFTQSISSDHIIHRGTVSTGGLGGGADRSLADFFQVALDTGHSANLAFTDDHAVSTLCPGCNSDSPTTRRAAVPYFTRQLHATSGIVAQASCAGSPPPPPPGAVEVKGEGEVNANSGGSNVEFSFMVHSAPLNATVTFDDHNSNLHLKSSNGIASFSLSGSCAAFAGQAKVNGQPGYAFSAVACDNGATALDTFNMNVTGPNGFLYTEAGTLASGDIALNLF